MPQRGQERLHRALMLSLCLALAAFLFVQPGSIRDESEHLHAAWLMAARGLSPLHGFFEHHLPLLWYLLELGFRAGMRGPESLYWARLLVIACAALWSASLLSLERAWSGAAARGAMSLAMFAAIAVFAQDLIVLRPETLALGLLGGSLWAWSWRSGGITAAFASGALFAGAVFASPRFALLAPAFLLAGPGGLPRWPAFRRAGSLIAGAVLASGAFILWLVPWAELIFDLRFSSILQGIGERVDLDMRFLGACILAATLFGAIAAGNAAIPRRPLAGWGLHGAFVWGASFLSAGAHPYSQAFATALAWTTLFVAWIESRPRLEHESVGRLEVVALSGTLVTTVLLLGSSSASMFSAAALTTSRRMLLDALPPRATVLMPHPYHPITADDASYWGTILMTDWPGRLCAAVDEYRSRYPASSVTLPRCSLLDGLQESRPHAVYRDLAVLGPAAEYLQTQKLIEAQYASTDLLAAAPTRTFDSYIVFRK